MALTITKLLDDEIRTVQQCLNAAAFGEFFPDWEFQTLIGVERSRAQQIATEWSRTAASSEDVEAVVLNSMNSLLGYPHGMEGKWGKYITVSQDVVRDVLGKLLNK